MKRSVLVVAAIMIVSYIAAIVIVEASEAYKINYDSRLDIRGIGSHQSIMMLKQRVIYL
ncbi:MAG: hypothetical protein QXS98_05180 [Candidatus Nitrosocaldus sp.]